METKFNQKKEKKPRVLIIAENKKAHEIKHVLELRDEMIANKIDDKLIKKYLDEQYNKINQDYEEKIKKYQENELKKQTKIADKEVKIKREKAIEFLLKNKAYLEEKGYKPEYIKNYVDKQYKEINQIYSPISPGGDYNVDLEQVNFID
jgi:hypothetical protein